MSIRSFHRRPNLCIVKSCEKNESKDHEMTYDSYDVYSLHCEQAVDVQKRSKSCEGEAFATLHDAKECVKGQLKHDR